MAACDDERSMVGMVRDGTAVKSGLRLLREENVGLVRAMQHSLCAGGWLGRNRTCSSVGIDVAGGRRKGKGPLMVARASKTSVRLGTASRDWTHEANK